MNKILLPSILAITILVAGIFALAPIEKASTVHTQLQATTAQTDTIVRTTTAGTVVTDLLDIEVDQDFTTEIGQFFATVTVQTVTITDIEIVNAGDTVVETIDFEDVDVVVGSQIVFVKDVHPNISLPAGWSIVIRGTSAGGTGVIQIMLGVITEGDAVFTLA